MTTEEIKRYLIREQGWDEESIKDMNRAELQEAWDNYHE